MVLDLFLFNENADPYIHGYLIIVKNLEWVVCQFSFLIIVMN
jgi:hypothetical protein